MEYAVRWAFHFEPKAPRYGMWNHQGYDPANQFSKQDLTGLKRVELEFRHPVTKEIKTSASCTPREYDTFEWLALSIVPLGVEAVIQPKIVGLRLKTKTHAFEFMIDGSKSVKEITRASYKSK